MSNFIIAIGHTASGNIGCGVISRRNESNCTREIGSLVAEYLKEKGHVVTLLRIDKSNSYNYEDCYLRVNEANNIGKTSKVDLYVEIHINAGGGRGPEVLVTGKSELANKYAANISNELSNALKLPNRGVKTRSLIVLNKTTMPAILVECLFADSSDAEVYNAEVIAKAIVRGLVGADSSCNREWKFGWNRNEIGWWYCTDTKNKYYYTSKNGWKFINGEWYIFDEKGYALQNTWYFDESEKAWYYLGNDCKMVRGSKDKPFWFWIDDSCYAFNEHGVMYCDCVTHDSYKVDEGGVWVK